MTTDSFLYVLTVPCAVTRTHHFNISTNGSSFTPHAAHVIYLSGSSFTPICGSCYISLCNIAEFGKTWPPNCVTCLIVPSILVNINILCQSNFATRFNVITRMTQKQKKVTTPTPSLVHQTWKILILFQHQIRILKYKT